MGPFPLSLAFVLYPMYLLFVSLPLSLSLSFFLYNPDLAFLNALVMSLWKRDSDQIEDSQ